MIVVVIILGVIGVWIYSDAKARGDPQPGLWAVAAMLFSILIVPVWLLKRGPKIQAAVSTDRMKQCPFCAENVKAAAIVCKHCHRELAAKA